ncbi:hypothetical protein F4818DRAFT_438058 [Hypoxylon cercidicola]|nr:hypothetical protein F4818DRAFT_438058 [Hypoxylon cercidicola]
MEYADEGEFFSSFEVFSAAMALAKKVRMDFEYFHIFIMAPGDMSSLLKQAPEIGLYGKILGIDNPREALQLFISPEMVMAMGTYLEYYVREDSNATPPHPATLYDSLRRFFEEPVEEQAALVEAAVEEEPYHQMVRSIEFVYRIRQYLQSDECKNNFPSIIDIRRLPLVGFTFLVVMLLTMVQQDHIGSYSLGGDLWDEEAERQWEQCMLVAQLEEQRRGRSRDRF